MTKKYTTKQTIIDEQAVEIDEQAVEIEGLKKTIEGQCKDIENLHKKFEERYSTQKRMRKTTRNKKCGCSDNGF
jgi:tRNA A-37 threonylcarbamoyl transferase component Bud32